MARHLASRGLARSPDTALFVSGAQHGLASHGAGVVRARRCRGCGRTDLSRIQSARQAQRLELVPIPAGRTVPIWMRCRRFANDAGSAPSTRCRRCTTRSAGSRPAAPSTVGRHRPRDGLILIEDAAYAFLVQDAPPPPGPLAPETTVYVTELVEECRDRTARRLRLRRANGFPEVLERTIRATTWNTPAIMTAIACGWLEDGTVTRLEAHKRRDATLRQRLVAACPRPAGEGRPSRVVLRVASAAARSSRRRHRDGADARTSQFRQPFRSRRRRTRLMPFDWRSVPSTLTSWPSHLTR